MNFWEYLNARAVRNASTELLIGRTQRSISVWTLVVVAGVLAAIFAVNGVDPLVKEILIFVLGGIMNNWATQTNFWYGRPRGAGIPDPTNTETTTKETKTVETETKTSPPAPTTSPADTAAPANAVADAAPKPTAGN